MKPQPDDVPSLNGVRLKLRRAVEHLDTLEAEMGAYSNRQPYNVGTPLREDDCFVLRLRVLEEPDQKWGVIAGELVHNLRSALDNLLWQLVLVNGHTPSRNNQFPVFTREPKRERLDTMLRGVHADHRAIIEDLQPYLGFHMHRLPRRALEALDELSNIDKHRYLHAGIGVLDPFETTKAQVRCSHPFEVVASLAGLLHEGSVVLAIRTDADAKVAMEGRVAHSVALGEPWATLSVLDGIHEQVSLIVDRFAPAFARGLATWEHMFVTTGK